MVSYTIDAYSPVVEIYLLDGNFKVQDRGLGRLVGSAPPGLYKVKFKAGAAFVEKLLELTPPATQLGLAPNELAFATPVPLEGTTTSHEYHRGPAEQLSRKVHKKLDKGSQLFVFVRDRKKEFEGDPAKSLRLLDAEGDVLLSLVDIGKGAEPESLESWHGCNVELDPGTYFLDCRAGKGLRLRMPVVTCLGWQTQVFLFRSAPDESSPPRPELSQAGILMNKTGRGFTSAAVEHLQWSELARMSLARNRAFDSPRDPVIRGMISEKFDDPMLGIYAAHCLLMGPDADRDLLLTLTRNLESLLGRHPDVESLKIALGMTPATKVWNVPPMLRSSWATIVNASLEHPEIIPPDSLAARAASRTWGEGAWFVWQEEAKSQAVSRRGRGVGLPLTFTEDAVYQFCLDRFQGERFFSHLLKQKAPPKHKVSVVLPPGRGMVPVKPDFSVAFPTGRGPARRQMGLYLNKCSDKDIARSLGLPRSTVQSAFNALRKKLK
jgi:hypothetical protein